jgi:aspartyl protease family protein
MLRYYFVFILAVGVVSTMFTGRSERPVASNERVISVTEAVQSQGRTEQSFDQDTASDELVLKREWDGHFYAEPQINGINIRMLVDTGATGIALSREDARRGGIGISIGMPNVVGQGAGGDVHGEMVSIDRVSLGGPSAQGMPAIVLDGGDRSLLGQAFLSKFASVEIHGDTMVLR